MKRVTFDFETRSMCDLKKAGAYKYSLHPTTQPTCLAFKISGRSSVFFLDFWEINKPWRELTCVAKIAWEDCLKKDLEFSAHNAFFERCIYTNILVKRYGWPEIPVKKYRCTAAKAAACALPRNLAGAGEAMRLTVQKDFRGYQAMMATCKPTRAWKAWSELQEKIRIGVRITEKSRLKAMLPEPPVFLETSESPEIWRVLYEYCKIDVLAEEKLDESLPDLNGAEQEIWHLNQELNWRGLRIDVSTVKKVVGIMADESQMKLKELDALTMGLVTKPGARQSILEFLALEGIELPDLRSKTVDDKLNSFELSEDMRRLLEIRKALSLTSTRKYHSFLNRVNDDGRVRDILLYHGASTGRDTGVGIQPQNFPRGLIKVDEKRPYAAVENVIECEADMLRLLYGDSLGLLFSAILRNMLIASEGHELFVADFSKIEVAMLWWLADNQAGLRILRAGKDPYIYQAASNLGKTYEEVERGVLAYEKWALDARQLGKAQVLGCGFGMGKDKFQSTAWDQYRLRLTEIQSKFAVDSYRTANAAVPLLWKQYEHAAVTAVETGHNIKAGKCRFFVENKFLWLQLPSGRRLAYREPQLAMRETDFGPRKTLEFWAVNPKTKKWAIERTWGGVLVQGATQAAARDLMMGAIVNLEKVGYKALLTVHDEALCEYPIGHGNLDYFTKIMCRAPSWSEGLPLEAKGWKGPRYRK